MPLNMDLLRGPAKRQSAFVGIMLTCENNHFRSTPSKACRPSGSILKPVTLARVAMNTIEWAIGTQGASAWKITCACR